MDVPGTSAPEKKIPWHPLGRRLGGTPELVWIQRRGEKVPSLLRWKLNSGCHSRSLVTVLTDTVYKIRVLFPYTTSKITY